MTLTHGSEQGTDRYNVVVHGFTLGDDNKDGVYEPDTLVHVSQMKYFNEGGMTLPSGSVASFVKLNGLAYHKKQPTAIPDLGPLQPNEEGLVPGGFTLKIKDVPVSLDKPHVSEVSLTSNVSLIGRNFLDSNVTSTVRAMYPVRITNYKPPELLGPNEKGLMYVAVKNISKAPFGSKHGVQCAVQLKMTFVQKFMLPMSTHTSDAEIGEDFKLGKYTFQVLQGGKTCVVDIVDVQPGQTVVVCIPMRSTPLSAKRLYASFPVATTLVLRKKTISKYTKDIRIVPVFDASQCYDVLLVTCNDIDQKEFQGWDYLFQLAGLAYAPWDIHRYKRLTAAPELSWVGRAAFVVLPAFKQTITAREFVNQDVVTHFEKYDNTSVIIVGGADKDLSHCLYSYSEPISSTDVRISCVRGCSYRCDHCLDVLVPANATIPNAAALVKKGQEKRRERLTGRRDQSSPSEANIAENNKMAEDRLRANTVHACMMYNGALQTKDKGRRSHQAVADFDKPRWSLVQSICGANALPSVEFHRCCLPADANLLTVKNVYKQEGHITGGGLPFTIHPEGDDLLFMPRPEPIHLGTPWGATFFGVLTGLPAWIIAKLMVGNDFVHGLTFHVSLTKKLSCPGTNTCCAKTVAGRDVSFFDVLYGILHDKLSRSLLTPRSGARVVPPSAAIEQFVQSTLLWHGATDPLIVERGESVLSMYPYCCPM